MARETEPRLIVEGISDRERVARLALFVGAMRERPEVAAAILRVHGTPAGVIEAASQVTASQQEFSYMGRILAASAAVFVHEDDRAVVPDAETAAAAERAVQDGMGYGEYDPRILRMATLAGEYALYQDSLPYIDPDTIPSEPIGSSSSAMAA